MILNSGEYLGILPFRLDIFCYLLFIILVSYLIVQLLGYYSNPEKFPYPAAVAHLKTAKEIVGADRLMFGTDMPCALARDSYAHLRDYIIESDAFTPSELADVFYNTANSVYF